MVNSVHAPHVLAARQSQEVSGGGGSGAGIHAYSVAADSLKSCVALGVDSAPATAATAAPMSSPAFML